MLRHYGDGDVTAVDDGSMATSVEEWEETLDDGTIVKRRVVTTTEQQLTTEKVHLEQDVEDLDDVHLEQDDDEVLEDVTGAAELVFDYSQTGLSLCLSVCLSVCMCLLWVYFTTLQSDTSVCLSVCLSLCLSVSAMSSILWSHHEETRELTGERDNARDNARCTQARQTTHGLDGQHQYVNRTSRGRVNQNDRDKWRKYVHGVANRRIEDG